MPIKLIDFQINRPSLEISQEESLSLLAKAHALHAHPLDETDQEAASRQKSKFGDVQDGSESNMPDGRLPISNAVRGGVQSRDELSEESLLRILRRVAPKSDQIATRGLESLEMSLESQSILERTQFFDKKAREVFQKFYPETSLTFDHVIHVSCTGYAAPSAAQRLVSEKLLNHSPKVTHAYHMGCYASIPAVRMAEGFVNSGDKKVDIVHTEICSLHMNPRDHSPEQLVVQSLFADGYIRYSAVDTAATSHDRGSTAPGLKVLGHLERIIPESTGDMTWITADFGMKMTLSRQVPEKISAHIKSFVADLCLVSHLDLGILADAVAAIHPGGPRIIDAVCKDLELKEDQVAESRYILKHYGNMSSATLPHIWMEVLKRRQKGKKVLSLAFGPGLTMFGTIFEIV